MIGAIKRRWKSNKKCADKDKEKVTPLPSFPATCSSKSRKGTLPPVDFIHVNSGRIELHPGAAEKEILWGQHLHYEGRHSWCGPQQGIPNQNQEKGGGKKKPEQDQQALIDRITELEKLTKEMPQIQPVVNQLKEDLTQSISRQEHLAADLDTLHLRVNTLETHNKALANIILPTLIRLTKEKSPRHSSATPTPKPTINASTLAAATTTESKLPATSSSSTKIISKSSPTTPVKSKTMKKPDSLDLSLQNSPKLTSTPKSECRIPRIVVVSTKGSTTHPPKTSGNANQVSKPKSKLPVRKSSSGQSPSSSLLSSTTKTPMPSLLQKPTPISKFAIAGCEIVTKTPEAVNLPPKDEGYSTMSNGAIDSQDPPLTTTTTTTTVNPTATFTRPKKPQEKAKSGYATTTTSSSGSGTWTKTKEKKSPSTTSPKKSPKFIHVPSSTNSTSDRTFATATILQPASITTTKENVRIVRGTPHEIRFSSEYENDSVLGPVLWEDSDDSDILFLPIEVSSSGSESTLVPYPYSTWSYTTTSTMTSNCTTTALEDSPTPTTPTTKSLKHDPSWDSTDEQDLVQRWMRLEDTRNAGTWGEEQFEWDWDGIIHAKDSKHCLRDGDCDLWGKKGDEKSLDSSTWTRSKKSAATTSCGDGGGDTISLSLSEEQPPTPTPTTAELDFTAAFYRLTSSGTEDKIIQTETCSSSSVENLNSDTDLFMQCKNCLEKMSKLNSLQENQGEDEEGLCSNGNANNANKTKKSYSEQVSQILLMQMQLGNNKEGSSSKWRPVPKDLRSPQAFGQQNFVLMSSTESEGLVSPSME